MLLYGHMQIYFIIFVADLFETMEKQSKELRSYLCHSYSTSAVY